MERTFHNRVPYLHPVPSPPIVSMHTSYTSDIYQGYHYTSMLLNALAIAAIVHESSDILVMRCRQEIDVTVYISHTYVDK